MATLQEKVGMRIGLTLTDNTNPSRAQVQEFLQEGLNTIQTLLDPEDLWAMTKRLSVPTPASNKVTANDFKQAGLTGFAQIISVFVNGNRATEVPAKDWHLSEQSGSMYHATADYPVFSYQDGTIVVSDGSGATVSSIDIDYLATLEISPDQASIPNVPAYVESVVINYATAQAASMLAAYYAQEEDPIGQSIQAIASTQMAMYDAGLQKLLRKSKIRGNIS